MPSITLRTLGPGDSRWLRSVQGLFQDAFEDPGAHDGDSPSEAYHESLLASDTFIALVAIQGETVVGAIAAYELRKLERPRKEIYLYDLAVADGHRRQGIASALIRELQSVAARRGAEMIFVQAHPEDEPAVALYAKHGPPQQVIHVEIPPQL